MAATCARPWDGMAERRCQRRRRPLTQPHRTGTRDGGSRHPRRSNSQGRTLEVASAPSAWRGSIPKGSEMNDALVGIASEYIDAFSADTNSAAENPERAPRGDGLRRSSFLLPGLGKKGGTDFLDFVGTRQRNLSRRQSVSLGLLRSLPALAEPVLAGLTTPTRPGCSRPAICGSARRATTASSRRAQTAGYRSMPRISPQGSPRAPRSR